MIVSGRRPNRVSVPPEASENYSIPDGSSMNNDVVSGEFVPTTELQELFESAAETITSLFKLSTLIRNATSRDRYARAMVAAKEPLDDSFDISQVGHKFPRVHKTPWLEQRLGKAITLRWQYLKYCHEHHHRLAKDKKHHEAYQLPSQEWRSLRMLESEMQQPNTEHHPDTENRASRTLKLIVASTLAPSLLHKTDDLSDENLSLTSYATSRGDDNSSSKPKVPSFPETAASGMPFECPYCWGIQNLEDERSWRKHVFHDLKPYVCTFEACDLKMFADRRTWFDHELQVHWLEWCCQFCSCSPFKSLEKFEAHLQRCHIECFTVSQLPALAKVSQQTLNKIPATACPFCEQWESILKQANPIPSDSVLVVTPAQYRHHVGAHMEQLALFAISGAHENVGNDAVSTELSKNAKGKSRVDESNDTSSQISNQDVENPPLHIAAYVGIEAEVMRLLDYGEDVNTKGYTWGSALGAAVIGGHSNMVKILLERGADIKAQCGQYNTVLEAAAAGVNRDIQNLLQDKAAGGWHYAGSTIEKETNINVTSSVINDEESMAHSHLSGQMQDKPASIESSVGSSPDRSIISSVGRSASPVVRVKNYTRGESPARVARSMVRSSSKRRRESGTLSLAMRYTASNEDEEDADGRAGLDPAARLQLGGAEVPNFRDQEKIDQIHLKNSDVENWLARSSEPGGVVDDPESRPAPPQPSTNLRKRRNTRSTGDNSLSRASRQKLRSDPTIAAASHIPGPGRLIEEDSDVKEEHDEDEGAEEEENSDMPESPPAGIKRNDSSYFGSKFTRPEDAPLIPKIPPRLSRAKRWQDPVYDSADPGVQYPSFTSNAAIIWYEQRAKDLETSSRVATCGSSPLSESDPEPIFRQPTVKEEKDARTTKNPQKSNKEEEVIRRILTRDKNAESAADQLMLNTKSEATPLTPSLWYCGSCDSGGMSLKLNPLCAECGRKMLKVMLSLSTRSETC